MRDMDLIQVGLRIRQIRKERGLSLQQVALKSGLSKSLLSKIENFRTIPSLPVLLKIAQALDTGIVGIVEGLDGDNRATPVLVRKNERQRVQRERARGFLYEALITKHTESSLFEAFVLTLEKGAERKSVSTDGDEFLFMLKGRMEFSYGDERLILKEGDSFFFDGRVPHVPRNLGQGKAMFLVAYLLRE